ncbi:Hypothetical protein D9617_1g086390 [Elsinoe fawcettii]|nr:Hypothetical protein D9617_1g086390 [Elsinoe fawcettii]
MTFVVALRAFVRVKWVGKIGMDDWFIWLASICALTNTALTMTQTQLGLGLPIALRPKQNLAEYTIHNFANRPVYVCATTFFKLSLCSSYMRMISSTNFRQYRIAVWAGTGITCSYGIAYLFAIIFACKPVARSWDPTIPGVCFPVAPFYYGTSIINCCIDLMLFILPIPLLLKLQIDKRRKIGLVVAFGLGTLTTLCSIMRSYSVGKVIKAGDPVDFVMFSTVEINVGIITASIPALAPLLKYLKATTLYSSSSRSRSRAQRAGGGGGGLSANIRLGGLGSSHNHASRSDKKGTITEILGDGSSQSSTENILGSGKTREVEIGRGRGYTGDLGIGLGQVEVRREVDLRVEEVEVEKGMGGGAYGARGREF